MNPTVSPLIEVLNRFKPKWMKLIESHSGSQLPHDCSPEDIFQMVAVRLIRKQVLEKFTKQTAGKPLPECVKLAHKWISKNIKFAIDDEIRRGGTQGRNIKQEVPFPDRSGEQVAQRLFARVPTASAAFSQVEWDRMLRDVIDSLKPEDREILYLFLGESLP